MSGLNSFKLSKAIFDYGFENPGKLKPTHYAIYFYALDLCNRLGGKEKFGFPAYTAMEALGIARHQTFSQYLQDLIDFGFIVMEQKSTNQYTANIISIKSAMLKNDMAHAKALLRQPSEHRVSTAAIDKHRNLETTTIEFQNKKRLPDYIESIREDLNPEFVKYIEHCFMNSLPIEIKDEFFNDYRCYIRLIPAIPTYKNKVKFTKVPANERLKLVSKWIENSYLKKAEHTWQTIPEMAQHCINYMTKIYNNDKG